MDGRTEQRRTCISRACHGSRAAAALQDGRNHTPTHSNSSDVVRVRVTRACIPSHLPSRRGRDKLTVGGPGGKFAHLGPGLKTSERAARSFPTVSSLFLFLDLLGDAGEFAPGRMMRCRGGLGGSMGLARRPQRLSPRSRPKSSSSLVCMRDRSFFPLSELLGCPPSFPGGVHLSSSEWNLWGREGFGEVHQLWVSSTRRMARMGTRRMT